MDTPENIAILNESGQVVTIVRGDQPEGWQPTEGMTACPVSQLPEGWVRAPETIQTVRTATKLTIKRRLEALGKWEVFKAVMAAMPSTVQDEWTLAQEINETDPMFVANREALIAALSITSEQLDALFAPN